MCFSRAVKEFTFAVSIKYNKNGIFIKLISIEVLAFIASAIYTPTELPTFSYNFELSFLKLLPIFLILLKSFLVKYKLL